MREAAERNAHNAGLQPATLTTLGHLGLRPRLLQRGPSARNLCRNKDQGFAKAGMARASARHTSEIGHLGLRPRLLNCGPSARNLCRNKDQGFGKAGMARASARQFSDIGHLGLRPRLLQPAPSARNLCRNKDQGFAKAGMARASARLNSATSGTWGCAPGFYNPRLQPAIVPHRNPGVRPRPA